MGLEPEYRKVTRKGGIRLVDCVEVICSLLINREE